MHRGSGLGEELRVESLRTSGMRFWDQVPAVVLFLGCAFGQNPDAPPASVLPLPSTSAMPVSRAADLTPDASGAVPKEQIRELLRRAEEKDLETISGSAITPTSSVWRSTNSMVMAR